MTLAVAILGGLVLTSVAIAAWRDVARVSDDLDRLERMGDE